MGKFVVLLLLLLLLPAAYAHPRITRTALVGDEFLVGVAGRMNDASVSLFFLDTGDLYVSPSFDSSSGTKIKRLVLSSLPTGEYYARVTVSNDYSRVTRYRLISVE